MSRKEIEFETNLILAVFTNGHPWMIGGNTKTKEDIEKIATRHVKEIKREKGDLIKKIKNLIQDYRLFYTAEFMDKFNKLIKEHQ